MAEKPDPQELKTLLTKIMSKHQEPPDPSLNLEQVQERAIEAEKILLRDGSGKSRGKISANADGSAGLILSDSAGTAWAWLGVNQAGEAFLELKDKKGEISFRVPAGAPGPEAAAVSPELPRTAAAPEPAPSSLDPQGISRQPSAPPEEITLKETAPEIGPATPPVAPIWPPGVIDTALYDRLEALEQQNRGRKFFRTILLGVLAVILVMQAFLFFLPPSPKGPLEVQSLMVRDQNGSIRAWLGEKDGKFALNLRDQQGKLRAMMGLGGNGSPALILYDEKQRPRAELQLGPDGDPKFFLTAAGSLQGKTTQHNPNDPDNQQNLAVSTPGDEDGTMTSVAASQNEAVSREVAAETIYVGSATSNKYHLPACKWAKTIKPSRVIKFKSVEEAQTRGYLPCPVCKPPPLSK